MRLINTQNFERSAFAHNIPQYAILSHRWEAEEMRYRDYQPALLRGSRRQDRRHKFWPSVRKIQGACARARQQGLGYIWIDSVCIDKSSSEELRFSISSMFNWYHDATLCITFLGDVSGKRRGNDVFRSDCVERRKTGQASLWFERAWTLQELLAPQSMAIFDRDWRYIGTRDGLARSISKVTGIDRRYLLDKGCRSLAFREASVATKMSWMAGRTATFIEDIAYSLQGIFGISMEPVYGEGPNAFIRLQELLMMRSDSFDESLFAWELPPTNHLKCYRRYQQCRNVDGTSTIREVVPFVQQSRWGFLAPSPDCFVSTRRMVIVPKKVATRLGGGFNRTHQGIFITIPLKEAQRSFGRDRREINLPLNCWDEQRGMVTTVLKLVRDSDGVWTRADCHAVGRSGSAKVSKHQILDAAKCAVITVAQPQAMLQYPRSGAHQAPEMCSMEFVR